MFHTTPVPQPEKINGYPVIRTRRRTLAIQINSQGIITIRAPLYTSTHTIQAFLTKQKNWITKHQTRLQTQKKPPKKFIADEEFYYLGKPYPLSYTHALHPPIEFTNNQFVLSRLYRTKAQEKLTAWYKQTAKKYLIAHTLKIARQTNLHPTQIRLSSARRRWGSCSALGTVSLSWRLILAPPAIIDYVICHELAHLAELNHSPKFWSKVAKIYPTYPQAKKWLKQNHHLLEF